MRRFAFAFLASLALVASPITSAAPGSPRSGEAPLSGPQADYNGDGFADLAVGIPYETVSGKSTAGAVNVLYGTAGGLTVTGTQLWHQDSPGVRNQVSTGDYFGDPIAPADFNGDGFSDLAIGVPDETVRGKIDAGAINDAGAVNVLYGGSSGLTADGTQFWNQDSPGITDAPEDTDFFGYTFAAGNWGNGSQADLAIAAPYETIVGDGGYEGAVHVLYGSQSGGLSSTGSQFWNQGVPGVPDQLEPNDFYGLALA